MKNKILLNYKSMFTLKNACDIIQNVEVNL